MEPSELFAYLIGRGGPCLASSLVSSPTPVDTSSPGITRVTEQHKWSLDVTVYHSLEAQQLVVYTQKDRRVTAGAVAEAPGHCGACRFGLKTTSRLPL